ncbi:MAG: methyltransferase domain-containing protein [Bacteroidetes bacterium]|nr:methyltransferase domain-containing protein [Bacteroidota bacterium]
MSTSADHYRSLLASIYSWMVGGLDEGLERGARELDDLGLVRGEGRHAVDLGAGFGMHAIPLARRGFNVTAIDESEVLLDELEANKGGWAVTCVRADICDVRDLVHAPPAVVLCMGDTISHLGTVHDVRTLVQHVASTIAHGGMFVITYRDLTTHTEAVRIVPVRSDADRILTCVLVNAADHVDVHDIVHTRIDGQWHMQQSTYRKLKISTDDVERMLEGAGFDVRIETTSNGMVRFVATKHPVAV